MYAVMMQQKDIQKDFIGEQPRISKYFSIFNFELHDKVVAMNFFSKLIRSQLMRISLIQNSSKRTSLGSNQEFPNIFQYLISNYMTRWSRGISFDIQYIWD